MNGSEWEAIAAALGSENAAWLAVSVSVTHDGEDITTTISCAQDPSPGSAGTSTGDGVTLRYVSSGQDSARDTLHIYLVQAAASYRTTGTLSQTAAGVIQATAHTVFSLAVSKEEIGIETDGGAGNIVDQTWQATYAVEAASGRWGLVNVNLISESLVTDLSQSPSMPFDYSGLREGGQAGARAAAAGLGPLIQWALSPSEHQHPKVR